MQAGVCWGGMIIEILKRFRNMGMVVEVKGKGKGKYRFIYQSELKDQNL